MASKIIATGGYLPEKILSNTDLEEFVETNDEWIKSRTGIEQRHIAAEGEFTSHMGYKAACRAIENSDISKDQIDLIITCTNTPDNSFPSTANKIQGMLDIKNIPSFDLSAICSGFIYGLHMADSLLKANNYQNILLICSEKMSSLLDWKDRSTCVLFGDGAGAIILQNQADSSSGIIDTQIFSNGNYFDMLNTSGGVATNQQSGYVQMNGREVFRSAVEKMTESAEKIISDNNFSIDDIDYFIPHQANERIINAIGTRLGIKNERVIKTIKKHANCSAASIPLALDEFRKHNEFKSGDLILFSEFGAGISWGSSLIYW